MFIIKVTKEDINKGCHSDITNCPVARAVKRTFKNAKDVEVDQCCIEFKNKKGHFKFVTPSKVANFISTFDLDGKDKVKPFSFKLSI